MNEFSADWLALREPADRAARSLRLSRLVAERLAGHEPVRVLDLGTGTGANLRFLAEQFPAPQQWTLVDRDAALLRQVAQRVSSWGTSQRLCGQRQRRRIRAPRRHVRLPDRDAGGGPLEVCRPVALRRTIAGHGVGPARPRLGPLARDADDAMPRGRGRGAVCADLRRPHRLRARPNRRTAWSATSSTDISARRRDSAARSDPTRQTRPTRAFQSAGYEVDHDISDWQLTPARPSCSASCSRAGPRPPPQSIPRSSATIDDWKARRLSHIAAGVSLLTVGHTDLAGWLR